MAQADEVFLLLRQELSINYQFKSSVNLPEYLIILNDELSCRSKKNSRYSLRAMARDFDMHPSALSRILRGLQKLTVPNALKILELIRSSQENRDRFRASYFYERCEELRQQLGVTFTEPNLLRKFTDS